jgi:hypothetical protein
LPGAPEDASPAVPEAASPPEAAPASPPPPPELKPPSSLTDASAAALEHVATHAPFEQPWPSGQTTPQPPQLFESPLVLAHVTVAFAPTLPHAVVPAGQEATQAPFAQTSVPEHIGPQTPAEQI